jgi:hypothetical protein
MRAYRLLLEASHQQATQLVAFAAFDAAWSEIQSQYPDEGPEQAAARYRLASEMLPFINDEVVNPLSLKDAALTAFSARGGASDAARAEGAAGIQAAPCAAFAGRSVTPLQPSSEILDPRPGVQPKL